jgi:hypothetical protein
MQEPRFSDSLGESKHLRVFRTVPGVWNFAVLEFRRVIIGVLLTGADSTSPFGDAIAIRQSKALHVQIPRLINGPCSVSNLTCTANTDNTHIV